MQRQTVPPPWLLPLSAHPHLLVITWERGEGNIEVWELEVETTGCKIGSRLCCKHGEYSQYYVIPVSEK